MKTTLIFLHGGPGFKDYLEPFFKDLKSVFNCVFYDQVRGPDVKIEDMLTQLDHLIDSIPGKIIIVGHSWGAILATEYAAKNQSKLSGLVLMSTGLNNFQWKEEYHKELETLGLNDAGPERIFLTASEFKVGASFLSDSWETFSEETFNSINSSYLEKFDALSILNALKIPVLNIFGEKDVRFSPRVAKTFKNFNDNIQDFQIPDVGHFPFLKDVGRLEIYEILKNSLQLNGIQN